MENNYFTPENSWKHLFFITGLTADKFYTDGGLKLNIEQFTFLELKKRGYERIVFYDKDNKLYCYDDDSFELLRVNGKNRKGKNGEVGNGNTLIRQNRGLKRGKHAQVVSSSTSSHSSSNKNVSTLDVVHTSDEKDSYRSFKSDILIKSGGNGPLHLGMRDITFVKRQIDAYMHNSLIKTAVVINDANAFYEEFGREPVHSLTAGYERMGIENENILVFIYTDGDLANFYKVNQFDSKDKDANIINIERPNTVELKNMLMYLRWNYGLKIHMRDLDDLAISLHQAMALGKHQIRINEVYLRLKAFGTNKLLTPDLCYELVGVKKPDSAKKQLSNMIGMQSVKDALKDYDIGNKPLTANFKYMTASRLSPNLSQPEKKDEMIHFVLTGNPGTGKTTVAKLLGQMFYEMGYLEYGHVVEVDRSKLVAEYIGQTAVKTTNCIQEAMGGVLFIDEAYTLKRSNDNDRDFGQEAIDTLLKAMDQYKGKFIVVAAGYPKEMDIFINSNPGLQRRFTEKIHIEDYTAEEMYEILLFHAKKNSVKFSDELSQKLPKFCDNWVNSADENWGNAGEAVKLIEHMIRIWKKDSKAKSVVEDVQTIGILEENHIPKDYRKFLKVKLRKEETSTSAMEEIDNLIGFEDVKARLRDLISLKDTAIKYDREDLLEDLNFHWVLRGNPGTGKTTVAKLIGKVYKELGLLSRGHTVETTRAELVAEYEGQTAVKTKKCIERAMGGILFIDEAYSLKRSSSMNDPFGQEAIDTLLERMSALNGKFAVIAAGYPKEMDRFLDSNPGFQSRFGEDFLLKDYTSEELTKIFEMKCNSKKFFLEDETRDLITKIFGNMIKAKLKNWANGRVAENLEKDMRKVWAKNPKLKQDSDSGEMISYYTKDHIPARYEKYLPREAGDGKEEHSGKVQVENAQATCTSIPMNKLVVPKKEFNYEETYLKQVESVVFIRTSTEDGMSSGSGSIITNDGYILTCSHVISGAEGIQVRLQNRKNVDVSTTWENADIVWEDTELDAAILKIRDGKYNALPLRTLETGTFTGEAIYLWGYPFGGRLSDDLDELQASLFQGYISSIQTKNGIERINTNMEAKRGCSGGPVFSKKDGSIIGILCGSQTVGDEDLIEEINYVLPVKHLFEKVFK